MNLSKNDLQLSCYFRSVINSKPLAKIMKPCVNHPDKETGYACMKHDIYMCEKCLVCRDPEIYCKFRSSCPIHFITKRKGDLDSEEDREDIKEASG